MHVLFQEINTTEELPTSDWPMAMSVGHFTICNFVRL